MTATVAITTATIPATKTHKERRVRHTSNETGEGQHDATVTVSETTGVRVVRHLMDTYRVEFLHRRGLNGTGWTWLVVKDETNGANADTVKGRKDADRLGSVYECSVAGEFGCCTCDGFTASKGRNRCVHIEMFAALIEAGLPHPQAATDPDPFPSAEQMAEQAGEDFLPADVDSDGPGEDDDTGEFEVEPYRDDADAGPAEPDAVVEMDRALLAGRGRHLPMTPAEGAAFDREARRYWAARDLPPDQDVF